MNDTEFNFNEAKHTIQFWSIGYYKDKVWRTLNLPSDIDENIIEAVVGNLNKKYDVVYTKTVMGVASKDTNYTKKGEFICL